VRIDVLTIFPGMFVGPTTESILQRAQDKGIIQINLVDIRDFTRDKHHCVDDSPFGGGSGMVLKGEPVLEAVEAMDPQGTGTVVLLSPQGQVFNQQTAFFLSSQEHLVLICGHYEGFDERIKEKLQPREISIGDYILTGGELAAMVVMDAVARLIPGVLGKEESSREESFSDGLLEYPQYTRPREVAGLEVPAVLLSGDHQKIRRWRRQQSLVTTFLRRPDLLAGLELSPEDRQLLAEVGQQLLQFSRPGG
jgi:tRNA (guanine37-N1)-methyltransferase